MSIAQPAQLRATNRLRLLLQSFRAAALDALAHLLSAADRRALALSADAVHDRTLAQLVHAAALGADEASVRGCGCDARFDRVIRLGRDAQRFDAVEDQHYSQAFTDIEHGRRRIRVVASTAERVISGRAS